MAGDGIARATVIGERCDFPDSSQARPGVGIAEAPVEGIAAFGADAQGAATVAVTRMVPETKALSARLEARWAVAQGAEAFGAVEKMEARVWLGVGLDLLRDHGAIVVGHG